MAKVSNKDIRINEQVFFPKVGLYYTTSEQFYMEVPSMLNEKFDCLSQRELEQNNAEKRYESKRYIGHENRPYRRYVWGKTEDECIKNFTKFCRMLVESATEERDVIVVYYQNDRTTWNSREYAKGFERTGFTLGMLYCREVKTVGMNKPIYYVFNRVPTNYRQDEFRIDKVKASVDERAATIIDDTPENRAALESIYNAVKHLQSKLEENYKSADALLNLIANNGIKALAMPTLQVVEPNNTEENGNG